MFTKAEGIVLRAVNYKETDVILTILTKAQGKLTAKARGVRRNRSTLKGAVQLLSFSEFNFRDYNGFLEITEADCIEMFETLRSDIELFGLGCYFAQAADLIALEDVPNPEIFSLLMNSLYALKTEIASQDKVKAVFELKAACYSGYMPDLSGCRICGCANPDRFDIQSGCLVCSTCQVNAAGVRMPLSSDALAAMRYVSESDCRRMLSFRIQPETEKQLSNIAEAYLSVQLEHSFSALDFYKSLFISMDEVNL